MKIDDRIVFSGNFTGGAITALLAPLGATGPRVFTDRSDLDAVTGALRAAGWTLTTSEMGYVPKDKVQLPAEQRLEVEEFLEAIDDHDDCHRIYTALV